MLRIGLRGKGLGLLEVRVLWQVQWINCELSSKKNRLHFAGSLESQSLFKEKFCQIDICY